MESLIDQLIQQGVRDFFLASGSRSTPLVLAAARHPKATLHTHLDERALGFFALGFALGKEAPAALIVTSGTAVGNLLPAVMEAYHASIPLILLTADRPAELRESGANQTTDQLRIFQNFTRWQFDFDPIMPEMAIRSKAAQAVFHATASQGPVHLNCPLREPLYCPPKPHIEGKKIHLEIGKLGSFAPRRLPANGLILAGKLPKRSDIEPILALGRALKWPIFADVLSNARLTPTTEQIRHFDWMPEMPEPSCVLHFGQRMVSKRILEKKMPFIHISPSTHFFDPAMSLIERIQADVGVAAASFTAEESPGWLGMWQQLDAEAEERLQIAFQDDQFTESAMIRNLSLKNRAVFLGTSMPVREADWFLFSTQAKAFFSNRGLSGIDGNLATAAGIALGMKCPVAAIVGDLTALHDLNALSLIKQSPYPIHLLISNNGGGGIFSHLPVSKDTYSEALFAFSHRIRFSSAAALYDLPFYSATDLNSLHRAFDSPVSCVIEAINSREENYAFHQRLKQTCLSYSSTAF